MSQNDMNIANADGATVRADINSALQALVTLSSGTTEPSTKYAGQLWWDTTANLVKQRNGANNAWITLYGFDGTTIDILKGDTTPQLQGFLDPNSQYIGRAKGGDIASASPFVVDTDGDYFDGTGTTNFSAFTVATNRKFSIRFTGILTITHGANLVLPGAVNYTTAAGDILDFQSTAANTVVCTGGLKVDGTAFVSVAAGFNMPATSTGRYNSGSFVRDAGATGGVVSDRLYFQPFVLGAGETFDRIGIKVTSSSAGSARLGIYSMETGLPVALTLDAGTVSTSTTGDKEITISKALNAGSYVLCCVFDATPTVLKGTSGNIAGVTNFWGGTSKSLNAAFDAFTAHTFGVLPTPPGSLTYNGISDNPYMWLRAT